MTYNKFQIYGILKDYHWMLREIKRIDYELSKTDFQGVAQYGVEATLPHAVGIVGRALENEIVRRSKKSERLYEYVEKVNFINGRLGKVQDEKLKVTMDCMLDGMSMVQIGKHLGLSRRRVHELRDEIVNKLVD
jgi:hypothetical protein